MDSPQWMLWQVRIIVGIDVPGCDKDESYGLILFTKGRVLYYESSQATAITA